MIQVPPEEYLVAQFVNPVNPQWKCKRCNNVKKDPVLCAGGHNEYCKSCFEKVGKCQEVECKESRDTPNTPLQIVIEGSQVYCYSRLPDIWAQGTCGASAASVGGIDVTDEEPQSVGGSGSGSSNGITGRKRSMGSGAVSKKAKARTNHCTWMGKLKDAKTHFRVCEYAGVVCSLGCGAVVARKDKAQHEATCDHRALPCKWEGCGERMMRGVLDQHQAACPRRKVKCPNFGCTAVITLGILATHKAQHCRHQEVPCPAAFLGCTARIQRKDIDKHMKKEQSQHTQLIVRHASEQDERTKRLLQTIKELQGAVESLKHHVMPDDEIILLQVKYDELTGKAPFVPRYRDHPTKLCSADRVVRGYKVRLHVETNDTRPEFKDHYGVYLSVQGGPFPCKVQFTFELVHYDGQRASAIKCSDECTYTAEPCGKGYPTLISKARLASPDNNPYVKDGYLTFTCSFKFV